MRDKVMVAVIAALFGAGIVVLIEGMPEQRAKRDVARCREVARILVSDRASEQSQSASHSSRPSEKPYFSIEALGILDQQAIEGYTLACLFGGR